MVAPAADCFLARYRCIGGMANSITPDRAMVDPARMKPGLYERVMS